MAIEQEVEHIEGTADQWFAKSRKARQADEPQSFSEFMASEAGQAATREAIERLRSQGPSFTSFRYGRWI